jgi:hypothetical protein
MFLPLQTISLDVQIELRAEPSASATREEHYVRVSLGDVVDYVDLFTKLRA